ncbi:hypothetical protein [Fusobacterium perfoetens]|uniref:hypothetical protein n=1 Tax=Fusobacterium perfoetens TaxID=852 RepID=UPI0026ECBAEA|nr:hypothetical protein [Fusobacterium perfoetens]
MSIKIKQQVKKYNVFEHFAVISCILLTDTVTLTYGKEEEVYIFVIIGGLILLKYLVIKRKEIFKINKKIFFYLILPIIFIYFSKIINFDSSLGYEYKIMLLFLGYIIVEMIPFKRFIKIYINCMTFITFISLCVYFCVIVGDSWWKILPLTNTGDTYSLIFTGIPNNMARLSRNYGPFWEPGVFQVYLNFAFIFQLYKESKERLWKNIILFLGLITTFSTTGYICFAIVVLCKYLKNKLYKAQNIIYILCSLIIGLVLFKNDYIQEIVFSKFSSSNVSNSSFIIRLKDIKIYFIQWIKNIFFGVGITNSYNRAVEIYMNSIYSNYKGTTSTTFRELACFGIIPGISRLILQWKFCELFTPKKIIGALYFIIIIFLNTEDLIYSFFINTIFYYSIKKTKKYEERRIEKSIKYSNTKL